jgi:hypothetical protein
MIIPLLITLSILVISDFITSKFYAWYSKAELVIEEGILYYDVTELVDVFGHKVCRNTIKSISKVTKRGRNLIIYGDILVKEPLAQAKSSKKLVIMDITKEAEDLVNQYKEDLEIE